MAKKSNETKVMTLEEAKKALNAAQQTFDELTKKVETAQKERNEAWNNLQAVEAQEPTESKIKERDEALKKAKSLVAEAKTAKQAAEKARAEADEEATDKQAKINEAQGVLDAAQNEFNEAEEAAAKAKKNLETAKSKKTEADSLEEIAKEAESKAKEAESEYYNIQGECDKISEKIQAWGKELGKAQEDNDKKFEALEAAKTKLAKANENLENAKKLVEELQKEYGDKVVIKTAEQETIAEVENQTKGESMEARGIKANTPDGLLEEIKSEVNVESDSVSEPVEETAQPEVTVAEDISAEGVETPIVTNSPENPEVQENVVNPVIEEPVEVIEEPVEVAEVNPVEETAQPEVVNANEDGAEIEMPNEAKEENDLGKIFEKSGKEFTDGLIKFLGGFKNSKHEYNAILNAVGTWLAVEKTDAKAIAINETIMSFPKVAGVKIRDEIKAGIEDALVKAKDLNEVGNSLNAWYVMDGADGIKSAKNVVLRVEEIKNKKGIKEGLKNALTGYQFAYANAEEKEESEPRKTIKLHLSEILGKEVFERLNPGKAEDRIQMLEKATRARQKSEELRHEAIEKASVTITSGVINAGGDATIKQPVVHWREVEHKTREEQLDAVIKTTKEIIEKEQTDSNLKAAADRYIKQAEKTIKLIAKAVYSSFRAEDLVAQKVESVYPVLNAQSVLEKATEELNKMVKSGEIKEKQAQEAFDLLYKAPLIGNAVLKATLYEGGAVIAGVKDLELKPGETLYKLVSNGTQPVQESVVANPNIVWDSGVEVVQGEQITNVTGFEDEVKNAFRNGVSLSQFKEQKNLSEEELLSKKDVLFKEGKAYALELTRTIADATSVEEVEEIVNKVENFCNDFKLCMFKDQSTVYCEAKANETFNEAEASM